ncbi:RnaseH-domain-containing protein, partial [Cerioporus squamosus]
LHIVTDSKYVLNGLTVYRRWWESQGWLGLANGGLVRATIARLRARSAPTTFRWVKGHSGVQGNEGADALAKQAVRDRKVVALPDAPLKFIAYGAALACVTQKLAYKFIRKELKVDERYTTRQNLNLAQRAIKELTGEQPLDAAVWMKTWKLETDRPVRVFWWKMLHGAYRLGSYWLNIPACSDRALCRYCGALETMEHVLCVCNSPWRVVLWSEATGLLVRRGIKPDDLSFPHLLAVGVLVLPGRLERTLPADVRLTRIVLMEMVYLTWVVRCEWTIGKEGDLSRLITVPEILNRWYWRINRRLWIDVALAKKAARRCVAPRNLVLETWRGLISCEGEEPEDWMSSSGVLVGR